MRAAVCNEFGQPLAIEELELDPPGIGEVTVRVAACGVCHSDVSYADGAWGGTLPAVYGHEVAGNVEEVGPGVEGVAPGDRAVVTLVRSCGHCFFCARGEPALCEGAFALDERAPLRRSDGSAVTHGLHVGGFAELVTVHASQVVPIPEEVPLDSACLLACAVATGFGAVVNTARVGPGASTVVIGAGGVGLNSLQGAAISGAYPIVVVDVSVSKLEAAKAFGATHGIDASDADVSEAVRELTGGRGADHVFVTVGSQAAIEQGLQLAHRAGTVVIVGMPASGVSVQLDPTDLANDTRRILGSKMGALRPQQHIPQLVELYRGGLLKLDELVSGRYPLEEINEAVDSTRRGDALRNVIAF